MLACLCKARRQLGSSVERVIEFLHLREHVAGGFRGRSDSADLYYTVFGLEGLLGLDADMETGHHKAYLDSFGDGRNLDLVHLASLLRCRANLAQDAHLDTEALSVLQCIDGGFHTSSGSERGSAYGCFLALGMRQELGSLSSSEHDLLPCVRALRRADGGFANDNSTPAGSTPATAAALCVLHYLRQPEPEDSVAWLLAQAQDRGGFLATPGMAMVAGPDLLSTATALFALSQAGIDLTALREPTLDYLDSLWDPQGGFRGSNLDPILDCEYTYYGLLALGCLTDER